MDQTSESSFHPMDRITCPEKRLKIDDFIALPYRSAIERGVSRASGPLYCRVLMIEE